MTHDFDLEGDVDLEGPMEAEERTGRCRPGARVVVCYGLAFRGPAGSRGTFVDDDGLLHQPDIEAIAAAAAGITQGCSATQFCPGQVVTRAQMAAFLTRALDLPPAMSSPFTDSSGQFLDEINRLAASGISTGCGGGRFCLNDPVTRAQMATFLTRGLGLTPIVPPPRPQPLPGNPDGNAPIPAEAAAEDSSNPTTAIGTGTPPSCTSQAVVQAVAAGGIIPFTAVPAR